MYTGGPTISISIRIRISIPYVPISLQSYVAAHFYLPGQSDHLFANRYTYIGNRGE
jgi:hypothetical protein